MHENQPSLTALMSTYVRGHHAKYDTPKIFDDFLAFELLPAENRNLIEQGLLASLREKNPAFADSCPDELNALRRVVQSIGGASTVLFRAHYTEALLEAAIKEGAQRYVILGAGLDTFAFRRSDLLERIEVFEIDHPATQSFKLSRIEQLGWRVPSNLHFIAADFTHQSVSELLKGSAYDPDRLTFFSWLGVTMYLTRDEVFATLRDISENALPGSILVFDYLNADAFDPEKVAPRVKSMMQLARAAGEPMKTGFDPVALAKDLEKVGLRLVENLTPREIQSRYFEGRDDNYLAHEHVNMARIVVK